MNVHQKGEQNEDSIEERLPKKRGIKGIAWICTKSKLDFESDTVVHKSLKTLTTYVCSNTFCNPQKSKKYCS